MNIFKDMFIFRLNQEEEVENYMYLVDLRPKYIEEEKKDEFAELKINDFTKDESCMPFYI